MESGSPSRNEETFHTVLNKLFSIVLDTLAETDIFSRSDSPSIFVVYAHDNNGDVPAYATSVHKLITWLKHIRARLLSDKSPLPLWSNREGGDAAVRNILSNQFCILPADNIIDTGTITSVDKVIVCSSPLLEQYSKDRFTPAYIESIERSYNKTSCQTREVLQREIRNIVETECDKEGFHHVLTELAFIKIRHSYMGSNNGVIPIALDGQGVTYLPYLQKCDLFLKLKSSEDLALHKLFFNLLRHLYVNQQPLIDHIQLCYDVTKTRLQKEAAVTDFKFDEIVYTQINKTLYNLNRLGISGVRQRTSSKVNSRIDDEAKRSRIAKFLKDLSALPYRDRKDRNPERVVGTCEWFTNHKLFRDWQDSKTSSLLWVSADPGCGKSVLAKHLVDNVLSTTSTRTTCYFFFKDDFEDQRNLEGAFRCILHQLFDQRRILLSDKILERFEEDGQLFSSLTCLWDILTEVASSKDAGEIICIIDALDECEDNGRTRFAKSLNRFYKNDYNDHALKFLLTSRPYNHIQHDFHLLVNHGSMIHLSGENEIEVEMISQEIDIVIRANVREIGGKLELQDEEERFLRDELTHVPNRTYLWVYLIIDVILDIIEVSKDNLRARVRELPKTVEAAYEKILSRSIDNFKSTRLLHMVVAADRPLSLREMATALAVTEDHQSYNQLQLEPDKRFRKTIRALCGLFVIIVDSKIYLLHQTARDFLVQKSTSDSFGFLGKERLSPKWQNSLCPMESNLILAEACVWYLGLRDKDECFLDYAAKNWAAHFRKARGMDTQKTLVSRIRTLCDVTSKACSEWLHVYWSTSKREFPEGITTLSVVSHFGVDEVICLFLKEKKFDLDAKDQIYGRSALSWACENGYDSTVELLLSQVSKPKVILKNLIRRSSIVDSKDLLNRTPIWYGAANGHDKVVKMLLKKRARCDYTDDYGQTPLSMATFNGHEAVLRVLLEMGVNFQSQDDYIELKDASGRTPLWRAMERRDEVVVKLLLEQGAKVETSNAVGKRPLWWAIELQNESIVELLLEKYTEIDIPDQDGRTPLSWAAQYGNESTVEMLFAKGAKVEAADKDGRTPLSWALQSGNETVVKMLLGKGAKIEAADKDGRTPLFWVVQHWDEAAVKILLEKGANIEAADKDGQTPLSRAVLCGNEAAVKMLFEKGAEIEAADKDGRTPLSLVVCERNEAIVKILLKKGAKVEAADKDGRTPLSWAAVMQWNEDNVKMLLEKGAKVEAADKDGRTPLLWAVLYWNEATVKILLKKGANIEAADKDGRTLLSWAVDDGSEATVKMLLEKGAKIEAVDKDGRTPLSWAARHGNEAAVKMLLEKGAKVEAADKDGCTPLSWAVQYWNEATVKMLLKKGAKIHAEDKYGRSPLSWATHYGHEAAVNMLFEIGVQFES